MNPLAKGLPRDPAAEKSILAQPFLEESSMPYLRGCIEEDYFTTEVYRRIWGAACTLFDGGKPLNFPTVTGLLALQQTDIVSQLIGLIDGEVRQTEPDYLIGILAEKARLRRLMTICEQGLNQAALGEPSQEIYEGLIARAAINTTSAAGIISTKQLLDQYGLDRLLYYQRTSGLRLPWPRLNGLLAGLQPGQLVLMAAHTSQGKTSAALQIATETAKQGLASAFFSLEMQPRSLFRRMTTQLSGINPRNGGSMLEYEERAKERTAATWLGENPIWLDSSSRTVPAMLAAIRRIPREPRLGLVVVDYLQLIQTTGRPESRAREIGTLARELKLAAQEFGVPFLVLSQFNRESAKEKRRPELYDLKESGDCENHSDVVIILHATELEAEAVDRAMVAYVPKQREGPRGKEVSMVFRSDIQRLEEVQL